MTNDGREPRNGWNNIGAKKDRSGKTDKNESKVLARFCDEWFW
jgi:hypothetical protein